MVLRLDDAAVARVSGKTKCGDLSTAAAKCAAFGRDDGFWVGGVVKRARATATADADPPRAAKDDN
jgi:hypothetical protein